MPKLPDLLTSDTALILRYSAAGNTDKVEKLLEKNPKLLEAYDDQWRTPAFLAATNRHLETFRLLANKGADLRVVTKSKQTIYDVLLPGATHTHDEWEIIDILRKRVGLTEEELDRVTDKELRDYFNSLRGPTVVATPSKPEAVVVKNPLAGIADWGAKKKGGRHAKTARKTRRRQTRRRR